MSLIILNDLHELPKYSSDNVCVVKGVLNQAFCDELVSAVNSWRQGRLPNQDRGANWWYRITKDGSEFDSCLFWQLKQVAPADLREKLLHVYRVLFEAHVLCGTIPYNSTFDELLLDRGERPSLEPLIFFYKSGTGKFRRHAHELGFQQTQVLINLTKRNRDYFGGETIIEEANGNEVELGDVFDQGDLFSFPYSLFHAVKDVELRDGSNEGGRMSILLPFHPRNRTKIRY